MSRLLPNLSVDSIYDIDMEHLKALGIKGIITDLDNTLVRWDEPNASPKLLHWLDHVRDAYGFKVCIASNNKHPRVERFAKPLNIPYISKARKPSKAPFYKALSVIGTKPEETVMIGDQMFTDVLGGNRMGLYTILVLPIGEKEFIGTKVLRMMERVALSVLRRRGKIPWE